jgi:hypothetical protein
VHQDSTATPHATSQVNEQSDAIQFLSLDLVFASRVRAAAEAAGLRFSLSRSLNVETDSTIRFVIVDLSTSATLVDHLSESVFSLYPRAKWIAYAPHVQIARMERARQAGIPYVLTRGQFDRELPSLFRRSADE